MTSGLKMTCATVFLAIAAWTASAAANDRDALDPRLSTLIYLEEGATTTAPFAFVQFCVRNPGDCKSRGSTEVVWNRRAIALVVRKNIEVNRNIRKVDDVGERWSAGVVEGDCEDFALSKRRVLVKAGLPVSALRVAVARTMDGERHAVLVVKTNVGDFVLDNRTDRVLMPNLTDLEWIKMESAENPRVWRLVR